MATSKIDLYDPATQEDWYPTYARLREEAPVYRVPGTAMYVVSRYDDVLNVLRHQETFPTGVNTSRTTVAREVYETKGWPRITPLSVNPPDHRHYRALVDGFFDGRGSLRWKPFVAATIDELIDGFASDGSVELVERMALPLPVRVITHILGFPAADIPRLKAWSSAWVLPFSGPLTEEQEVWVAEQVVEFHHYISDHIQLKRSDPGDDVLSALTTATYAGERPLTDHEIITIIDHLYIGGNETTTFALTSGMWILLREPGLYERLLADPDRHVEQFVEEVLRLESPTQGLFRAVARDTEIAGVPIPQGSIVMARFGAANHDAGKFACPHAFDVGRDNASQHLAFGAGQHFCLGALLAKQEMVSGFNAILRRMDDIALARPLPTPAHEPSFFLRPLKELPIRFRKLS